MHIGKKLDEKKTEKQENFRFFPLILSAGTSYNPHYENSFLHAVATNIILDN